MAKLTIHKAIEILEKPLSGGTTRPLLAIAENGEKYVLKLFKKRHAEQRCYTAAEAYAHYLAREFELNVPEASLIQIPEELMQLKKDKSPDQYKDLLDRDWERPCFATKYMGDLPIFTPAHAKKYIQQYDIESIFAFDTLILNEDRKFRKPNILKTRSNYYLIDHEKAFEEIEYARGIFKLGKLCPYSSNHLFFQILRKKAKREGNTALFETFESLFSMLSLSGLKEIRNQLSDFQYNTLDCELWELYIAETKQEISKFILNIRNSLY